MRRLALRAAVAALTLTVGISAAGAWEWLGISLAPEPALSSPDGELSCSIYMPTSADEREILEIMRQYGLAQTNRDAAFFEKAEPDSYTVTRRDGRVLSRSQAIANMLSGDGKTTYEHDDLSVRFFGDAAIVTGWMVATRKYDEGAYKSRWKSIYLLAKRNGRWQILSTTQVN